ncbi:hypothetical protein K443DRAFT_90790 [Laccaria amethystina LaAM-08-1]|uniref:Uncharacterized protein n=1 Tax=Laccaria amethystina LaAM-08-1 TaxID=1095629 RepID=A0A0C9XVP7_9AGAR|nr:hypothetical protein K443DRAFT_90790 [Laccaria amethystina LaAM-08-1]
MSTVGTKLRDLFNEERWILLPEPHILALYLNGRCDPMSVPPAISESYYRYTILPLSDMASVPIRHHTLDDMGVATVQTHTYPYPNFGFIASHLHPHYVIFNSARTILKSTVYREHYPSSDYDVLFRDMIICYASWTIRIADLEMNGKFRPSRHLSDESDSGSDSFETKPLSTPRCRELTLPSSSGQQKNS